MGGSAGDCEGLEAGCVLAGAGRSALTSHCGNTDLLRRKAGQRPSPAARSRCQGCAVVVSPPCPHPPVPPAGGPLGICPPGAPSPVLGRPHCQWHRTGPAALDSWAGPWAASLCCWLRLLGPPGQQVPRLLLWPPSPRPGAQLSAISAAGAHPVTQSRLPGTLLYLQGWRLCGSPVPSAWAPGCVSGSWLSSPSPPCRPPQVPHQVFNGLGHICRKVNECGLRPPWVGMGSALWP